MSQVKERSRYTTLPEPRLESDSDAEVKAMKVQQGKRFLFPCSNNRRFRKLLVSLLQKQVAVAPW